jgi:NADH:ubiquinone oxidoreductase subunit 3 (subunit A)
MADQWLNVAIYTAAIVSVGLTVILVSHVCGPRKSKPGKLDPYECGVPILSSTRERFSVQFLPGRHPVHPVRHRNRVHGAVRGSL